MSQKQKCIVQSQTFNFLSKYLLLINITTTLLLMKWNTHFLPKPWNFAVQCIKADFY